MTNQADTFWQSAIQTPLQLVEAPIFDDLGIKFYLKRDDLIHPFVSGNKWRKLKYNLIEAHQQGYQKLLTFGGAYSNHLVAVAAAGQILGFETIGIVRGQELSAQSNPTLQFLNRCGMHLIFVNREAYRDKIQLAHLYGKECFIIPEGGTNTQAIKGVGEVIGEITTQLGGCPTYLCTPIGTGGTFAGLCSQSSLSTTVLGFCVLKNGQFLLPTIEDFMGQNTDLSQVNHQIFWDWHFGGYGKRTAELMQFIKTFESQSGVKIEQIYTGKMLYGIYELLRQKDPYFQAGDTIVSLHTGGLQGRSPDLDSL